MLKHLKFNLTQNKIKKLHLIIPVISHYMFYLVTTNSFWKSQNNKTKSSKKVVKDNTIWIEKNRNLTCMSQFLPLWHIFYTSNIWLSFDQDESSLDHIKMVYFSILIFSYHKAIKSYKIKVYDSCVVKILLNRKSNL